MLRAVQIGILCAPVTRLRRRLRITFPASPGCPRPPTPRAPRTGRYRGGAMVGHHLSRRHVALGSQFPQHYLGAPEWRAFSSWSCITGVLSFRALPPMGHLVLCSCPGSAEFLGTTSMPTARALLHVTRIPRVVWFALWLVTAVAALWLGGHLLLI